jgi:hypothetical protein
MSKASRVLSGWYQDREFSDAAGQPLALAVEGAQQSFTELVRRYGGDIPPVALLKQLIAAGAAERQPDGRVRALTRVYMPRRLDEAQIRLWGSVLQDVGTTLEHNLTRDSRTSPKFERRALSVQVDKRAVNPFRQYLEREGQAFLERVDDWLSAHSTDSKPATGGQAVRLGAGIYLIEDFSSRGGSK